MNITVADPNTSTVLFFLASLFIIGVGIWLIVRDLALKAKCTSSVQGTIIDVVEEFGCDKKTRFLHPVVSYSVGAVGHDIKIPTGTIRCKHKKGDVVTVCYNPSNPPECYIKDGSGNQTAAGIFFIVFGLSVLVPTVLYAQGILK